MGIGSDKVYIFSKISHLENLTSLFFPKNTSYGTQRLDFEIMQEFMVYCDDTGTF